MQGDGLLARLVLGAGSGQVFWGLVAVTLGSFVSGRDLNEAKQDECVRGRGMCGVQRSECVLQPSGGISDHVPILLRSYVDLHDH